MSSIRTLIAIIAGIATYHAAGPARAFEKCHPVTVPPWLEIEVLDPNAHPRGIPAVVTTDPDGDGRMNIDIPETVLVHRYYYTGDRSFQGPMIPGGPSIVVASHPKTGERCYINVQMLPGAPRVTYCDDKIEYNFGNRAVCICFGWLGPKVIYRNGPALGQRVATAGTAVCNCAHNAIQQSGIPAQASNLCAMTKNAAHSTCDGVHTATKIVMTPVCQVIQILPFGKMLTSPDNGEHHAAAVRERQVTAAEKQTVRLNATIPTLR